MNFAELTAYVFCVVKTTVGNKSHINEIASLTKTNLNDENLKNFKEKLASCIKERIEDKLSSGIEEHTNEESMIKKIYLNTAHFWENVNWFYTK